MQRPPHVNCLLALTIPALNAGTPHPCTASHCGSPLTLPLLALQLGEGFSTSDNRQHQVQHALQSLHTHQVCVHTNVLVYKVYYE